MKANIKKLKLMREGSEKCPENLVLTDLYIIICCPVFKSKMLIIEYERHFFLLIHSSIKNHVGRFKSNFFKFI